MINVIGEMINKTWLELPSRFPSITLGKYVIMPNHFHGIVIINDSDVGEDLVSARNPNDKNRVGTSPTPTGGQTKLGDVVRAFKSISTIRYIDGVKNNRWEPFDRRLWQRNYFDRIIRNEDELIRIRKYINLNPENWSEDVDNPRNIAKG